MDRGLHGLNAFVLLGCLYSVTQRPLVVKNCPLVRLYFVRLLRKRAAKARAVFVISSIRVVFLHERCRVVGASPETVICVRFHDPTYGLNFALVGFVWLEISQF